MIFVTVGNANQRFPRMLDAVDSLAGQGLFNKELVFIQSGNNPGFMPKFCEYRPFLSMKDFSDFINMASVVICHAGAGTLIHVFQAGKIPVVMPRHGKYGEHVDDHQVELVKALAEQGKVLPVFEQADFPEAVAQARRLSAKTHSQQPTLMLYTVRKAIQDLTGQ
jgi:beta-1,4-N-acetylglucosaminyltransferase